MAYETIDQSQQDGRPIELYRLSGADDTWRINSTQATYNFQGQNYTPERIRRSNVTRSRIRKPGELRVRLRDTHPFVVRYLAGLPPSQDTIEVWGFHVGDPDFGTATGFVAEFRGLVTAVDPGRTGEDATLSCESELSRLRSAEPNRDFRFICTHFLYDSGPDGVGCNLNRSNFAHAGDVLTISASRLTITVDNVTGVAQPDLAGGIAQFGLQERQIISHTQVADVATIGVMIPIPGLAVGSSITLFDGCDHEPTTCNAARFANVNSRGPGNIDNYGGCPYIPRRNIFEEGIVG